MTCFSMLAVCPTQAEIFFEWLNEDKGKKKKTLHYNQSHFIILFINIVMIMIESIIKKSVLSSFFPQIAERISD